MAKRLSTGLRNKLLGINTNKLSNGSFTADVTGWTAVNAVLTSVAGGKSGNCLQIAESGGANPGKAYADLTTKVGHLYGVEHCFKKGTADNGKVMIGTTGAEAALYDSGNLNDADWAAAPRRVWFLATATVTRITLQTNDTTAGETSLFDEIQFISMSRSIQDIFKDCFLKIYSGAQPASANDAPTGILLVTFFSDGAAAGLEFDDAVAGVMSKKATETWSGPGIATGNAGWFRLEASGDSGILSTTDERIDGAVGTAGAELNMSSLAIVAAAIQTINSFSVSVPATAQ